MIELLLEKGDYEAVLKIIGDNKDEKSLYQKIICLQGLGRNKEALEVAKEAIVKSSKLYYDILSLEIALLVDLEEDEEALAILDQELSMPYIPSEYEEVYTSTYEVLKKKQRALKHQVSPYDQLTNEELKKLLSPEQGKEIIMLAIQQLDNRNVRHFMSEVSAFLESSVPNYIKTALLEVLIDQGIDVSLKVKHDDLTIEVNPKDLTKPMEQPGLEKVLLLIDKYNVDKDVTIASYYNDLVIYYFASVYPIEVQIDEYEYIAAAAYYVAYSNLHDDYSLDDFASKYDLNVRVLDGYYLEIEKLTTL